ncbi:hypothetical protein WICMUC_003216 [Wickerhamomyces mucosus]|uniref:Phosphoglucomutase n=1 Tax=Wickerhamomyces mucosus TaxID=1378264 RepID=A0A9P8TDB2_9ASCO|nr:hypothetical protein WICMUC_003216 [Wickerhamomyces mucosus]
MAKVRSNLQYNGDFRTLEERLGRRLTFGTAGLRAKMEAGFNRLNRVTIMQASQGLASYLLKNHFQNKQPSIVIGHEHRFNSQIFAEITATIFLLKGFKVYYLSSLTNGNLIPTPLVPFAVDYFQTNGGVMITASHNPAQDNGYKVYWNNGCQIIPPHDLGIAQEIELNLNPIPDCFNFEGVSQSKNNDLLYVKEEILTAYILHLNSKIIKNKLTDLEFIYTPIHGVGLEILSKAVKLLGVKDLKTVASQADPDPYFHTVSFPNPEENGALNLAFNEADLLGIELIIANDPDADRFSAAVKHNGQWRQLTGNEIGYLFADYIYSNYDTTYEKLYFVNSTVSSQMIESMARILEFNYTDTLTGFKWIGNKAIELEQQGFNVAFGYEEAIGFMFEGIHDKDGISAALVFLQMAQGWKDQGTNAIEKLHAGFEKFGYFKEYNSYYIVPDLSLTKQIFDNIRFSSNPFPESIGNYKVTFWRDLTIGYQSNTIDNIPDLPIDPSSQMITVKLSTGNDLEGIRFTIRGSGTEPKLKVYIEAKSETEERSSWLAQSTWDTLKEKWFQPQNTGLIEQGK